MFIEECRRIERPFFETSQRRAFFIGGIGGIGIEAVSKVTDTASFVLIHHLTIVRARF